MAGQFFISPPQSGGSTGSVSIVPYTVGPIDTAPANPNGGLIGSNTLFFQSATATFPGLVSSANQTFSGTKNFNSPISIAQGTVTSPSLYLNTDSTSGLYQNGINQWAVSFIGVKVINFGTSGLIVTGDISAIGSTGGTLKSTSLSPSAPVKSNGTNVLVSGSISLTVDVTGNLPLSQTQGSLSLTTQVVGLLPIANGGATGSNTGDISIAAFGSAPNSGGASIGTGQVFTFQPASAAQPGGVSTGTQEFGGAKTFISTRTTTSTIGSVSITSSAIGGAYTITLPGAQGVLGSLPQNDGSGNLAWSTALRLTSVTAATGTLGSVSITSSAIGAAYTITLPGAQGGANTALLNDGAGKLSWSALLTNPMTSSGDMIVGSGTGVAARFAGNTSNSISFLTQTGSASASNFPVWTALKTPTVQTFSSGSALTYTTSVGARWLRIKMAGGGGGGAGSGVNTQTNGGDGGVTTFGSSLLTANGGLAGRVHNDEGGAGGTASVSAPALAVVATTGGQGQGGAGNNGLLIAVNGGAGGSNMFAGGGARAPTGSAGHAGIANTGGGGSGGSTGTAVNDDAGSGGGAGGYIEAIIPLPSATYTYTIGTIGSAGGAGTTGFVGGAGAQGIIIVEEHFI